MQLPEYHPRSGFPTLEGWNPYTNRSKLRTFPWSRAVFYAALPKSGLI